MASDRNLDCYRLFSSCDFTYSPFYNMWFIFNNLKIWGYPLVTGWTGSPPKSILKSSPLVPQNVILFRNWVIADIIGADEVILEKGKLLIWYTLCLYMKMMWRHRAEHQVKIQAETGVMCLQTTDARDCWQPQKLGEKHGTDSTSEFPVGPSPTDTCTSDFQSLELWEKKF